MLNTDTYTLGVHQEATVMEGQKVGCLGCGKLLDPIRTERGWATYHCAPCSEEARRREAAAALLSCVRGKIEPV